MVCTATPASLAMSVTEVAAYPCRANSRRAVCRMSRRVWLAMAWRRSGRVRVVILTD